MKRLNLADDCHKVFLKETSLKYEEDLQENEFVRINGHLGIYKNGSVNLCEIQPKNGFVITLPQDNYPYLAAINACLDKSISIVNINGPAGTGKTVSALASLMYLWRTWPDLKLVFIKENIPSTDNPLGFVKGTLSEKKKPIFQYLAPALEFIKGDHIPDSMRVETLSYILGETFHKSFVIVDEAQNLTPQNVDLLVTRIGSRSKIIFLGDNDQCYNRRGHKTGLNYLNEVMSGSKYYTEVKLTDSTLRSGVVQEFLNRKKLWRDKG